MAKFVKLIQPKLVDFSRLTPLDDVRVVIYNARHKFATDAAPSGTDEMHEPIFGSKVLVNGELFTESTFGLPFISFPQGSKPKITYEMANRFTTNIHYHGLNTTGDVDGVSSELIFGHSTMLGPVTEVQFPEITNNQTLLWFHSHIMFLSIELIAGGMFGLLQITDKITEWLNEEFKYGDNHLILGSMDLDLNSDGTRTQVNLPMDENRSCFTVINGISAVNWYATGPVPYVTPLYHRTTKSLTKIDVLNVGINWRVYHIGVCDNDGHIKKFWQIQNDGGLVNPTELTMLVIPVAGRASILVDLGDFKDHQANVFFYNYDLTEVFGSMPTFPDQPNNISITATIPDFTLPNPTPFPTPIPDPNGENQQGDPSALTYPIVPLIPQVEQELTNGSIKPPKKFTIKVFLKVIKKKGKDDGCKCEHKKEEGCGCKKEDGCGCERKELSLVKVINKIRKTIFKRDEALKCIIQEPCFEYGKEGSPKVNYLALLSGKYYYNLPDLSTSTPTRNIFLFPEVNINALAGGNPYGTTEYIDGANRIMTDIWNSDELNIEWALQQYSMAPNNYKPPILPSSKFRIYKTDDRYSNTAMISNDTLKIQIFADQIAYGDFSQKPLATVTIVFPETPRCKLMNIQEWIDLINNNFSTSTIDIGGQPVPISSILTCDWSAFPYAIQFLYQKTVYLKSAVIKTTNGSNYWIRLLGRWPLLQMFGKPMTGSTLPSPSDPSTSVLSRHRNKLKKIHEKIAELKVKAGLPAPPHRLSSSLEGRLAPKIDTPSLYVKCNELEIYGIYNAEVQQIFPFYATSDGDVQIPIVCMRKDAELIIAPQSTYIGLYDGYLNDNINSFSVKLHSTETWIYTNGDCADAHSLHFHLTQGFAPTNSDLSSPGLLSCRREYDPLVYSRDVYQVGPQQSVALQIHWPYYSSYESTREPYFRCIGAAIHCHLLTHNDFNSMIIQYFVDRDVYHEESSEFKVKEIKETKEVKEIKEVAGSCCKK